MFRISLISFLALSTVFNSPLLYGQAQKGEDKKADKKPPAKKAAMPTWTDFKDPNLPADFKIQGEYVGTIAGGGKIGCQVIALGKDAFQAVILPGGLIGAGWDGKNKILLAGQLEGDKAIFTPATGKRKYLARAPMDFSATAKFPPPGQKDYSATIAGGKMTGKTDDGKTFELTKTERKSPTLGLTAPAGALVLFDGTGTVEWKGGRLDKQTGWLNTDKNDITTTRKFSDFSGHFEFMLPYRPDARGQERANSGLYLIDLYEVQILDSFGLEGKNNECGGIYTRLAPKLNMCLPPLTWQTYDVDFSNAIADSTGVITMKARVTLKHNGVIIHDNAEIAGPTGGARGEPEGTPGLLRLQGHGNPLQFRNIWVVEKK